MPVDLALGSGSFVVAAVVGFVVASILIEFGYRRGWDARCGIQCTLNRLREKGKWLMGG